MMILYDGWPLTYGADHPGAIHLLTLLEAHPSGVPYVLALPGHPFHAYPQSAEIAVVDTPDTAAGRLRWEQAILPRLARRCGAGYIHTTGGGLALFGAIPGLVSPVNEGVGESGFAARLRAALGQGGASRARAWLWPADFPDPHAALLEDVIPSGRLQRLPPVVHPIFQASQPRTAPSAIEMAQLELPETFVLYHGKAGPEALERLLAAWSWAADAIGANFPLLALGLRPAEQEALATRLAAYRLTGTARPLPPVTLAGMAEIYRRCTALVDVGETGPWSGALRLALAAGKPVAAPETAASAMLVGPAGYLVPHDADPVENARKLGAALLTLVVEEGMAEAIGGAALTRAAWDFGAFRSALSNLYRDL